MRKLSKNKKLLLCFIEFVIVFTIFTTGNSFSYFSDNASIDNYFYSAKTTSKSKKTASYTITYNLSDGLLNEDNPVSYTSNDEISLNNPTKEGYIFTGWTGTDLTEETLNVTIPSGSTGDREYTANFKKTNSAETTTYDNSKSKSICTNVQCSIDELNDLLK